MSTSLEQVRPDENGSGEPQVMEKSAKWMDWIDSFSQVPEYRDCPDTRKKIIETEEFASLKTRYEQNEKIEEALKKRSLDQLIQDTRISIWNSVKPTSPPGNFERNIQCKLFDQELAEALMKGEVEGMRDVFYDCNWRWQELTNTAIVEIAEWLLREGRRDQACTAFLRAGENERAEEIVNQLFDEGEADFSVFDIKGIEKTTKRLIRRVEGSINRAKTGYIYCADLRNEVEAIFASLKDPLETKIEERLDGVGYERSGYQLTNEQADEAQRGDDIEDAIKRFVQDMFASLRKEKPLEAEIEQRLRRIADWCLERSALPNGWNDSYWPADWGPRPSLEGIAQSIFSFIESFDQSGNK